VQPLSRGIAGSQSIGYPVYGRGVSMVGTRNRATQFDSGKPELVPARSSTWTTT
jgi:4-hydroxy-4-methyl-2-oxoglutarate aldolase